jgi:hypothetical protein
VIRFFLRMCVVLCVLVLIVWRALVRSGITNFPLSHESVYFLEYLESLCVNVWKLHSILGRPSRFQGHHRILFTPMSIPFYDDAQIMKCASLAASDIGLREIDSIHAESKHYARNRSWRYV